MDLNNVFGFFVFIMGTMVGSFLNVCIVRLPHEKSVVFPGSHCVSCKAPIAWYDNIPLVSWLVLGGRCRACKAKISFRYLFVELLTGVVFFLFWTYYGMRPVLWPYLVMVSGFIVATFVDFEHRIIPDEVSVGGMIAGLVFSLIVPQLHGVTSPFWGLGLSLLGILVGGGIIYLMGMIGDFVFKKETMGGGDVKLMAMIGAFMGWKLALLTFFLAPFFGAVYGIVEKIRTKDSAIAYGPFIILAALASLFWGDLIINYVVTGGIYHL
ncbi:MAG: prepilin peptidase [Candidatus Omnitrophica bacterium]|nr:prepilin peptidase [Candidatus Omnitrophota bacterium]MDE2222548.1 prepilin peptidase [Candidatus Omnitrophota bacterium]